VRASRRLPLEAVAPYLVDVPHPGHLPPEAPLLAPAPPIDFRILFGNEHPVEIEVGFGKGLFLVTQAAARSATNFLGIEIERKYTLFTASRLARRGLTNVKLACTDARWFLKERVTDASVTAMHVYFPDPWWKKRHRKRKLFTRDFAEQCARVLIAGGGLHFITDVADYFAETIEMLRDVPRLVPLSSDAMGENLTNFERKYRLEGRAIHRALYEKRDDSCTSPTV
jgi:tRNA (guanine-N7-)-methyltransferase